MNNDIFRIALRNVFVLFLAIENFERLSCLSKLLADGGGKKIGPMGFYFTKSDQIRPQDLAALLGELLEGEQIYLVDISENSSEIYTIVKSKNEGGIVVQKTEGEKGS